MTRYLGEILGEVLCSLGHAITYIGAGCLITYAILKVAA
jgi:hypothetical protein